MDKKIARIVNRPRESEKAIEAYLESQARKLGGLALKYDNCFDRGYPDRLVLLPGGAQGWIETKSRGCKPTALQALRHSRLRALGQAVHVCDSKEAVDEALRQIGLRARKCKAAGITYEEAVHGV